MKQAMPHLGRVVVSAQQIAARLTQVIGKQVLPHFHEDPTILGGFIVRVGDRVFDGSVRRRMTLLSIPTGPRKAGPASAITFEKDAPLAWHGHPVRVCVRI